MSRFCTQCGSAVKDTAKFCTKCGNKLPQRQAYRPSGPVTATPPPPEPAAEEAPAPPPPPQYWESYDYPSDAPGSTSSSEGWDTISYSPPPTMSRPHDASRPLPPLTFGPVPHSARERARDIARNFALWAAGIVLFPVPFSDLVLLMPIQTAMVISIGKAYNVKDPPEKMLAQIAAACGASVFGQITTLFVANLIPIIGKLVSAPFVYGWTYGLGEVAMRYFETQGEIDQDEMKQIFKQVSRDATRAFRREEIKGTEDSFAHLREHLSEEDYRKLRERFGG